MHAAACFDAHRDDAPAEFTSDGDRFRLDRSAIARRSVPARCEDARERKGKRLAARLLHTEGDSAAKDHLPAAPHEARVTLDSIVLASASPRRLELLSSLGLTIEVRPSAYEEPDEPSLTPLDLARKHAREKALEVRDRHRDEVVVAADTVVDIDGTALGKPADAAEAARMLGVLSGNEHRVHTAFAIALPGRDDLIEESSTTRVRFFPLEKSEIDEYVASGEPMDKAGAYGIQGRAASLVESIDGDFYTVMGFPLARFVRAIRRLGFTLPSANGRRNR